MRRSDMMSEVGMNLTPGFGAMQELRRPAFRFRVAEPYKIAGLGALLLMVVAAVGHLH
jgi:hypothetical protein